MSTKRVHRFDFELQPVRLAHAVAILSREFTNINHRAAREACAAGMIPCRRTSGYPSAPFIVTIKAVRSWARKANRKAA